MFLVISVLHMSAICIAGYPVMSVSLSNMDHHLLESYHIIKVCMMTIAYTDYSKVKGHPPPG